MKKDVVIVAKNHSYAIIWWLSMFHPCTIFIQYVQSMKKILWLLCLWVLSLTLVGCSKTATKTKLTDEQLACQTAIQDYLANTNINQKIADQAVADGDNVTVDYVGRFNDYEVFDTSVESVAKACGKYNASRDYTAWLPFVIGEGKMIVGFENTVKTMKVGETKTVVLPPEEAYGQWDEKNIVEIKKTDIPEGDRKAGDELPTFFGPMPILEVGDEVVKIDTNPPLAGKTLTFDISVKSTTTWAPVELPVVPEDVLNEGDDTTGGAVQEAVVPEPTQ